MFPHRCTVLCIACTCTCRQRRPSPHVDGPPAPPYTPQTLNKLVAPGTSEDDALGCAASLLVALGVEMALVPGQSQPLADSVLPVNPQDLMQQLGAAETAAEWAAVIGGEAPSALKRALLAVLTKTAADGGVQEALAGSELVATATRLLPLAATPADVKLAILNFLRAVAPAAACAAQMVGAKAVPSLVQIVGEVKVRGVNEYASFCLRFIF